MSKSLYARCIRRWTVKFKGRCDSKYSPHWRKRDLRGYIRECALTTADSMVESLAENDARLDSGLHVGSPEFSAWYDDEQRAEFLDAARHYLNEDATNDQIDEEIENELEAWND